MIRIAFLLLILLLLVLAGCTSEPAYHELIGVFVANHGAGADTLVLTGNGSYSHSFTSPEGNNLVYDGQWYLDIREDGSRVEFKNFHIRGWMEPTQWGTIPEKTRDGVVRLVIDEDVGHYYFLVGKD